uniref:FLYWCH-type domain-containing protein n=1 Tax=Lygus hesperus TaxID=30085 RepID=A0A0K8SA38_LYGHE
MLPEVNNNDIGMSPNAPALSTSDIGCSRAPYRDNISVLKMNSTSTGWASDGGRKDGDIIYRNNFKFVFHKELKSGELRWSCGKRSAAKCKAYLTTHCGEVVHANEDHTHAGSA